MKRQKKLSDMEFFFAAYKVSEYGCLPIHDRKIIQVYLFDKADIDIESAFSTLIEKGYLSIEHEETFGTRLTGLGLKHYKGIIHSRLGLAEGQSILDPSETVLVDHRFENLGLDEILVKNLQMRWHESLLTKEVGAYLACVTMLGSILEGILYAILNKNLPKAMRAQKAPRIKSSTAVKVLKDWSLQDMINVAVEIKMVGEAVAKHSHELRDSRNLIHPYKQVTEDFSVDSGLVNISFEVLNTVLDSLINYNSRTIS